MKLKSVRCGICDKWFMADRNHCPYCGATRAIRIGNKNKHYNFVSLNTMKPIEMVRGVPADSALRLQSIL